MRLPDQLDVVQNVDARALQALIPPFALQGLVENAVEHGSRIADICRVDITIRVKAERLEMTVTDNGTGVPGTEIQDAFFPEASEPGRLTLLRRQLRELFGRGLRVRFQFRSDYHGRPRPARRHHVETQPMSRFEREHVLICPTAG